jgi:hypothetical protein
LVIEDRPVEGKAVPAPPKAVTVIQKLRDIMVIQPRIMVDPDIILAVFLGLEEKVP